MLLNALSEVSPRLLSCVRNRLEPFRLKKGRAASRAIEEGWLFDRTRFGIRFPITQHELFIRVRQVIQIRGVCLVKTRAPLNGKLNLVLSVLDSCQCSCHFQNGLITTQL